jgi:hypothetical protein
LLREPARWCAIFALCLALFPTLALLAGVNLLAKGLLVLADALADTLEGLR